MSETRRIARLLTEVVEGRPYHGPSLLDALRGVTATVALRRPPWSAHSIWELVLHMAAELRYARAVIAGEAGPWVAGATTWPALGDATEAAWGRAVRQLRRESRALARAIRACDDEFLLQKPTRVQGPFARMLHGTLHHVIFHTGQVSLLAGQLKPAGDEAASEPAGPDSASEP